MTNYLLHSKISGQGQTIVMLHGYLSSSHYFKHFRKQFESSHRVIALDLLGFGQSPKPKISYTYKDHVDAVEHTLKELNIKGPFILLGHSMGALISLRYATQHSNDVSKLILFNPPLFTNRTQMAIHHKATAPRYRIMLYSRARHVLWPLLKTVPRVRSSRRGAMNFTDTVRMSKRAREGSYHNVIGGATAFDDLAKLTMSTLLVTGQRDRSVYIKNLEQYDVPPLVQLSIVDVDHHPLVREIQFSAKLIDTFLKK